MAERCKNNCSVCRTNCMQNNIAFPTSTIHHLPYDVWWDEWVSTPINPKNNSYIHIEKHTVKGDFKEKLKTIDSGGIRTHARKTAALTQRLRPLGHRVMCPNVHTLILLIIVIRIQPCVVRAQNEFHEMLSNALEASRYGHSSSSMRPIIEGKKTRTVVSGTGATAASEPVRRSGGSTPGSGNILVAVAG